MKVSESDYENIKGDEKARNMSGEERGKEGNKENQAFQIIMKVIRLYRI